MTAVEFDAQRAQSAKQNLKHRSNVDVIAADGRHWPQQPADIIYVNFATPRPAEAWIDNLAVGGRLIFPLGVPREGPRGGGKSGLNALAVIVKRLGEGYAATGLDAVSFVFAEGESSVSSDQVGRLQSSLERGGWDKIRSLVWNKTTDKATCWCSGDGWALSFEEPTS